MKQSFPHTSGRIDAGVVQREGQAGLADVDAVVGADLDELAVQGGVADGCLEIGQLSLQGLDQELVTLEAVERGDQIRHLAQVTAQAVALGNQGLAQVEESWSSGPRPATGVAAAGSTRVR